MTDPRIENLRVLLPRCLLPDWVRLGRRLARLLRDTHHPDQRDALLDRLLHQVHDSVALREERRLNVPLTAYPPDLPITSRKDEIVEAIVRAGQQAPFASQLYSVLLSRKKKAPFRAPLWFTICVDAYKLERFMALRGWKMVTNDLHMLIFGIQDAAYMVTVPFFCPDVPATRNSSMQRDALNDNFSLWPR